MVALRVPKDSTEQKMQHHVFDTETRKAAASEHRRRYSLSYYIISSEKCQYTYQKNTKIYIHRLITAEGLVYFLNTILPLAIFREKKKEFHRGGTLSFYLEAFAICRATYTPLADACEREWVIPLPSPMM